MSSADKLAFIDRMRGLAILLVIAVHYSQNFRHPLIFKLGMAGQLGVQLFFVASAVTLCLSADRRSAERHPVRNFYLRRLLRIAPLYYLGIVAYWAIFTAMGQGGAYTPGNILANVLFVHGFVPAANNTIVPGGWSIGVEMAFYLVFPALYPAIEALWQRWRGGGLVLALVLAVAIALGFQALWRALSGAPIANNSFAYFFPLGQLPVFVAGIAWYLASLRERRDWPPALALGLFLTLFAACAAILTVDFVPLIAPLPILAAAAFVALAAWLRPRGGSGGWLAGIGKVSFSLYVLHFALVWGPVRILVRKLGGDPALELAVLVPLYLASVAVLFLAGRISKRLVEDPANAFARRIIERWEKTAEIRAKIAA